MAVRQHVVGIDGPETLEHALRSAFYLADDGLSTAAYLALARRYHPDAATAAPDPDPGGRDRRRRLRPRS